MNERAFQKEADLVTMFAPHSRICQACGGMRGRPITGMALVEES